jgi:hypothetical protein
MKAATKIIHAGHKVMCFQLRQDRITMLETQLIHNLGRFHASRYREQTQKEGQSNNTYSNIAIAATGVHLLISKLDLDMLHYLDINRHIWEVNFRQTHNPPKFTELDGADQAAAVYVANTILSYIKLATCKHTANKNKKEASQKLEAKLTAEIEECKLKTATHAVSKAISQAEIPKDKKSLKDVIIKTVTETFGDLNKKRKPTTTNTNQHAKKAKLNPAPKGKAGQKAPPATATPRATSTQKKRQPKTKTKNYTPKVTVVLTKEQKEKETKKKQQRRRQTKLKK